MVMYIKQKDSDDFEGLLKHLDEARKQKYPERKTGSAKVWADMPRIRIMDDAMRGIGVVAPNVLITWTMVKKAHKNVKEGRKT